MPAQFTPLLHWPDGSVRWALAEALISLDCASTETLQLVQSPQQPNDSENWLVRGDEETLVVQAGSTILHIDRSTLAWWLTDEHKRQHQHTNVVLEDAAGVPCNAEVEAWRVVHSRAVSVELEAKGWWHTSDGTHLVRFQCNLTAYKTGLVIVDVCIHNPKRAQHPGGLWDLGDPGSIHFSALALRVRYPESKQARLTLSPGDQVQALDAGEPLVLHQESSGGDQWQSRNHVGASGRILPRFRGYRLTQGGRLLSSGNRAAPLIELQSEKGDRIAASLPNFWQNFPSALQADSDGLTIWFFPKDSAEPYELQGGERKTQHAVLAYGQPLDDLLWTHDPLIPVIPAEHYESACALPWFRANAPHTALDDLIREGLDGPANFFHKREAIDEYGWRNFGDIFADHETLYQEENETPLISHYNNQYDAIYGFARQFAHTGDRRWFQLMNDLARHVTDIDIYHTDEDRVEYNHGLFWHTDHYLDAHTATHRTFSRHNDTSSTPGQTGGGPAAEHCYTSGLLYHYCFTGKEGSRQAVLDLAHWMRVMHEGQGGLLEQILALKKNELPMALAMLRGEHPSPHRYPFTRGTGNYLNAVLDAHLLEPDRDWLEQAESILYGTIHPADNVDSRDLLNVETGWSYLVLLTSVVRYIDRKQELAQFDDHYQYAVKSFLHYARWMAQNERPFLSDTKQLEFPNDTWVAQDIRKAMLMFHAARLTTDNQGFLEKGQEWLDSVCKTLAASSECEFSRILIILMQNYGPHQCVNDQARVTVSERSAGPCPRLTWAGLTARILARMARGVLTFRPGRERAWLEARMERS